MKKTLQILGLFSLLIVIQGCSNPYSKFYTDYTGGINVLEDSRFIISSSRPKLIQGSDVDSDNIGMLENNYIQLGSSSFNGADIDQRQAVGQAKKVHADIVIVYYQYTETLSGSTPFTLPDNQTSYHSGSIYGSGGGYVSFSGKSTTYGTKTTYIPYHVRRFDYLATYWLKAKPGKLGIHFNDVPLEIRHNLGSNKGVYVIAVIKHSPAFQANLIQGDVITKFNNIEIIDKTHFNKLVVECTKSDIHLELFRDGKTITKDINLNTNQSSDYQAIFDSKTGEPVFAPVVEGEK